MERLADENADRASSRFIVSDDPEDVAERIGTTSTSASPSWCSTSPATTSARYIEQFARDVLPLLRDRVPAQVA